MKIMVIGHGSTGKVLCNLFLKDPKVKSIICVEQVAHHLKNKGKLRFKEMNASNKKQMNSLIKKEKPNLLINASLPIFNKLFMQLCLENKMNYMDLAAYWDHDRNKKAKSPYKVEQLDFNERFKKAGIIGLINAGVSPGLTNLLAKECADFLEIDSMKIRLFEDTKTPDLYFPWSVEWLLDEINWKPLVYRNGKFKIMNNFAEEEVFTFPEGIGERKVYLAAQEEIGTIPLFVKLKNIDIKIFDNQVNLARFLMELGLASDKTIRIHGKEVNPAEFITNLLKEKQKNSKVKISENAQFAIVLEAEGKVKGRKKTSGFYVIFPTQKQIDKMNLEANFISYPTALAAKVFAMTIPKLKEKGVYPPEALKKDVRHEVLSELKKHVKIKRFEKS